MIATAPQSFIIMITQLQSQMIINIYILVLLNQFANSNSFANASQTPRLEVNLVFS